MKTTCLVLLTIGLTGLMRGVVCEAISSPAAQQASPEGAAKTTSDRAGDASNSSPANGTNDQNNGEQPDEPRGHRRALNKGRGPGHADLTKTNRPSETASNRAHSISATATNLRRPISNKPGGAQGKSLVQSETVKSTVRLPGVIRPDPAPLSNVRHHSPNAATVGGTANSNARNAGTINGTRMSRNP